MKLLIAVALAMLGCATGEPISSDVEILEVTTEAAVELVPEPESLPECHIHINAKESQQAIILQEAQHWRDAAGCSVSFGTDGIPFEVVSGLLAKPEEPGKYVYGVTNVTVIDGKFVSCNSITVSNSSNNPLRTLRHELGHCFGILEHTEDGLMKDYHYSWEPYLINEPALNLLCSQVHCPVYKTE